jgi:lipoyl(octanoyl) transferase
VRYAGRVEGLTGAWANVRDEATARRADEPYPEGLRDVARRTARSVDDVTPLGAREHKVAAIGVRARRWVTYHGMAFNVDPDLGDFRHIVPCGIGDRPVGSVKQLLAGEAGVVSSAAGSVSGADENGRGACGGGAFAVDADAGPDADLMRRAKTALLRAFEEVFETELTRRGGAPPV